MKKIESPAEAEMWARFAAAALQGMLAAPVRPVDVTVVDYAERYADAMIECMRRRGVIFSVAQSMDEILKGKP